MTCSAAHSAKVLPAALQNPRPDAPSAPPDPGQKTAPRSARAGGAVAHLPARLAALIPRSVLGSCLLAHAIGRLESHPQPQRLRSGGMARRFTLARSPNSAPLPPPPRRTARPPAPRALPRLGPRSGRRPSGGHLSPRGRLVLAICSQLAHVLGLHQDPLFNVRLTVCGSRWLASRARSTVAWRTSLAPLGLSSITRRERPERSLRSLPSPYRCTGDAATSTTINSICRSIWRGRGGRSSGCGARSACDVDARDAHACGTERAQMAAKVVAAGAAAAASAAVVAVPQQGHERRRSRGRWIPIWQR